MARLRTATSGDGVKGCALLFAVVAAVLLAGCSSTAPRGPAVLLTANIVDPATVNAVSKFNSCAGHAFPDTNSANSAKNYFWPTSTNFSTTDQIRLYAACDGTTGQNSDDTAANEQDRGKTMHLYCDKSSTLLRYFHINMAAGILGAHVNAGDFLGFASMLGTGQTPSVTWQNSSNFDIAVADGDDNATENYFSKLSATAFAAWSARGVTSVPQTINPGNPTCASFTSNPGSPDIVSFTPVF